MVAENECNRLKTVHFVHNAIKLTAVGKRQLFACELLPLPFLHVVNRSQRSLCRHVRGGKRGRCASKSCDALALTQPDVYCKCKGPRAGR